MTYFSLLSQTNVISSCKRFPRRKLRGIKEGFIIATRRSISMHAISTCIKNVEFLSMRANEKDLREIRVDKSQAVEK